MADYQATVDGFDELWRAYWNRGQTAPRAAETPKPPSNRVDANIATIDESLAFEVDFYDEGGRLQYTSSTLPRVAG